jgi:hypothetical protein
MLLQRLVAAVAARLRGGTDALDAKDLHSLGERSSGTLNRRRPAVPQLRRARLHHLTVRRVFPPGHPALHGRQWQILASGLVAR